MLSRFLKFNLLEHQVIVKSLTLFQNSGISFLSNLSCQTVKESSQAFPTLNISPYVCLCSCIYMGVGVCVYTSRHMYAFLGLSSSMKIFGISNPFWKPMSHSWIKLAIPFPFGLGYSRFKAKKNHFLFSKYLIDGVYFYLVQCENKLSNKEKKDIYIYTLSAVYFSRASSKLQWGLYCAQMPIELVYLLCKMMETF